MTCAARAQPASSVSRGVKAVNGPRSPRRVHGRPTGRMDRHCGSSPSRNTQSCSAEQSQKRECVSRRLKIDAVRASALRPTMHKLGAAPSMACSDRGRRRPSSSITSTSRALVFESDPSDGRLAHGETNATDGRRASAARNMPSHSGESPANATRTARKGNVSRIATPEYRSSAGGNEMNRSD